MPHTTHHRLLAFACLAAVSLVCRADQSSSGNKEPQAPSTVPPSVSPEPQMGRFPFSIDLDPGFPGGNRALELWKAGRLEEALEVVRNSIGSGVAEHRRRVMMGALWLEIGQPDLAAATLSAATGPVIISDHIDHLRASALLEAERPVPAIDVLVKIQPSSPLYRSARIMLAEAELGRGRQADALRALEPLFSSKAPTPPGPKALWLRGRALEASGKPRQLKEAAECYQSIVSSFPLREPAKGARKALKALEVRGVVPPPMTQAVRLSTAEVYLKANLNRAAIPRFVKLVEDKTLPAPLGCRAYYGLGKAYQNLKQYSNAVDPLTRAGSLCDHDRAVKALYRLERGHIRRGHPDEARKVMEQIISRYKDHSYADDAMYILASDYQSEDDQKTAILLLNDQIKRFPTGDMRGEASWRLAWAAFREDRLAEAITLLEVRVKEAEAEIARRAKASKGAEGRTSDGAGDGGHEPAGGDPATIEQTGERNGATRSVGARGNGGQEEEASDRQSDATTGVDSVGDKTSANRPDDARGRDEASGTSEAEPPPVPDLSRERYWIARWRELAKTDSMEAVQGRYAVLAREAAESYYGLLAFRRLEALSSTEAAKVAAAAGLISRQEIEVQRLDPSSMNPMLQRSVELLKCGLVARAVDELTPSFEESLKARDLTSSYLLEQAGAYSRSHNLPRAILDQRGDMHLNLEHRSVFLLGYPRAFDAMISSAAIGESLDPLLLTAIAREESGFNPSIRSWAGAIGLVQLMPGTAKIIARQLGLPEPSVAALTHPRRNLALGARYLRKLVARYQGRHGLAVPAYNAGEGAVDRWQRERGALPYDEFVEEIPYRQTRNYTKRVLEVYQTYHLLDASSPPVAPLNISRVGTGP